MLWTLYIHILMSLVLWHFSLSNDGHVSFIASHEEGPSEGDDVPKC